jgi:hypothetical protein
MNEILMILAPAAGILAFFGGIALCMWVESLAKAKAREQEHSERMKALEMGQPLPDAEVAKARAAGTVGTLVPLIMVGGAIGATFLILSWADSAWHVPLVCSVWAASGVVCLVTVAASLRTIRHPGGTKTNVDVSLPEKSPLSSQGAGPP